MSEGPPPQETAEHRDPAQGLTYEQARLAYSIIGTLLEHSRALSDLVALMAQALDQETTDALTQTPHWNDYMDSRRAMERTRDDIERFTEVWTKLAEDKVSGEQ